MAFTFTNFALGFTLRGSLKDYWTFGWWMATSFRKRRRYERRVKYQRAARDEWERLGKPTGNDLPWCASFLAKATAPSPDDRTTPDAAELPSRSPRDRP